jgi:hypothetical protein
LQKRSQETGKHGNDCNQQCPLIAARNAVTISNVQPLSVAMLGVTEVQPFLFGYTSSHTLAVQQSANLHPPTLLSLACALTI